MNPSNKTFHQPSEKMIIDINGLSLGGKEFIVIAGPCSIESEEQIITIAKAVKEQGASLLRGGAFKPRTSPYDFQGLGKLGLQFLRQAADQVDLPCVSEIMSVQELDLFAQYVDVLQIGSRNMQNYSLLKALGRIQKPILLKRGFAATYEEWLLAAEYILNAGNPNVILCERGIRTFEKYTRNTLDITAVPVLQSLTHLPIIVDPSHGIGKREFIPQVAKAVIAVKANGLMVEVHHTPDESISDAEQAIDLSTFAAMMTDIRQISLAVGMDVKIPIQ